MKTRNTLLFSATAAALLAGCVSVDTKPVTQALADAPLPAWSVGDVEVWSDKDGGNKNNQTVTAIDGERVSWQREDNESWMLYRNFALPAPTWDIQKFGKGTQEILSSEGELFPLKVGNTMNVAFKGSSSKYPQGWQRTKRCKVQSQENVAAPAGSFDTFKVHCSDGWAAQTWYYAPALGTNVIYLRQTPEDREYRVLHSITRNTKT